MFNLRGFDLNLITVFEAVYEAGSISRAADRLHLSQSAASHALARLRDACGDDLFVRSSAGVVPTPMAKRIYPEIRQSLDSLRRSLAEAQGFNPASSTRRFRVAIPHPAGPIWALAIAAKAKSTAPEVAVDFDTRTAPSDSMGLMRAGELDLSIDWLPEDHDSFVNRKLFSDDIAFITRLGHPRVSKDTDPAALRKERFISFRPRTQFGPKYLQDLRRAYLKLDIALFVNEALEIPYVVLQTDLIGFVPRSVIGNFEAEIPFHIAPAPFHVEPIPIFLVWHESRRTDAGHEWLRELIAETVIAEMKR